jgi:hypothetical protein
MAHIAHQPGPGWLYGGVSRWLAWVVVWGGGGCTSAGATRGVRRGALLQFAIRVPKKNARCPGLGLGTGPEGRLGRGA